MTSESSIINDGQLAEVLSRITFENTVLDFKWRFEWQMVFIDSVNGLRKGWLVSVTFERPDTITGKTGRGKGREEVIWEGTSLSGVVKTCWLLVELMVRHELMEGFCFDHKRIFNPHNTVTDLAALQEAHNEKNKLGH